MRKNIKKVTNRFYSGYSDVYSGHSNRSWGFSLIELVMTMAILAIMAVVISSYLGGVVGGIDLDATADVIVSDLRNTQVQAMSGQDGEKWGVCFRNPTGTGSGNEDRYQIYSAPTFTCIADSDAVTLKTTVYLPNGITFTTPPADANVVSVIFNKIDGTIEGATTDTTIKITSQQGTRTITITPAGLISHD